jgi:hypothetical protein
LVAACAQAPDTAMPAAAPASVASSAAVSNPPPAVATAEPIAAKEAVAAPAPPPAPKRAELPGGGRTIFPEHQLVGFCGTPNAPALGPLLDHPAKKAEKLLGYATQYANGRKVLPVFELIAVLVMAFPGNDGKYRMRVLDSTVDEYLAAARESHGLLLLNIQPGRSDFLTEVKRFEKYLHEPDVGVALDPEWAVLPKQQPNKFYGQTTGDSVNEVIEYLSGLVTKEDLPEKVLVFHMVNGYVVKDESVIKPAPGVAIVKSVDGFGPMGTKIITYNYLVKKSAPGVHPGFKLFFDEDRTNGGILMTPKQVLALVPQPEYVMYE